MYLSLCVVSLGIATFFWMLGAHLVMPFAWLEIVAVGIAFAMYGRHAADGERISLQGSRLVVELETAGRLERAEFDRSRVRVEPKTGDHSLITLSAQGRSVEVGAMCAQSSDRPWHRRSAWPCALPDPTQARERDWLN